MNKYKNLCPFKWYVLENFPFIEADFDAITNWQLLCKLGEEINKVIDKTNLTGQQVEALTNAFIELENYVNNYFKNLDVQEEINNKLDEMAESGELAELINNYINNYIKLTENFVLFAFFDENKNNEISFYVSRDNIHLSRINTINKIYGRDPSIIFYNNKFYVAVTQHSTNYDFIIYESNDLENWTTHYININLFDENYQKRWCPEFFIDDNNDLYIFIAKQYANTEGWGDFSIYISKCININTLEFQNATQINLIGNTSINHIDPACIKIGDTYHLLVKNETQTALNIEHYISTDLINFNLVDSNFANLGRYVEGTLVYKFNNKYYVGVEKYSENNTFLSSYRITSSSDFINFSNYEKMYSLNYHLSHGSAFPITNTEAKNIILAYEPIFNYDYNFQIDKKTNYLIAFTTTLNNTPKGRYLKLFSVKPKHVYKSSSVLFNIFDGQSALFNSNILFTARTNLLNPTFTYGVVKNTQIYSDVYQSTTFKTNNLFGKIVSVPNEIDKTYDIYLDLSYFNRDLTVMINFLSFNNFMDDIIIYTDNYTNELPDIITDQIFNPYRTKNACANCYSLYIDNNTNSSLDIQFACINGSFKILGHYNSTNKINTIDYTVNVLNGTLNAINNNSDLSSELNISLVSYNNGIYTMRIANIPDYSNLNINLQPFARNSILDCYNTEN